MEPENIISIVAIIASALVGGYSTWLYHQSRVDANSEHLYKEQVEFLKELRYRFADLMLNKCFDIKFNNYTEKDFELSHFYYLITSIIFAISILR